MIVHSLDGPDGVVTDPSKMLQAATDFYKDLFKKETCSGYSLKDDFFSPKEKITEDQNKNPEAPFSEEEVKDVIFGSYSNGAPGPDGFTFLFYQHFWDLVKNDIMAMFRDFSAGKLDLFRLNFAILTLIPKEPDASAIKKFRPISLLNCIFKIFTKVLTNRLALIMNVITAINQSTFIKGRFILESVVTAHEIVHSVVQSKDKGVVLKLDYEKAFDKVDPEFLLDLLRKRGFGEHLISLIKSVVLGGSVGVKMNNIVGNFFITGKGLRQGDPLSPLLFDQVVDALTRMLVKASTAGLIKGLCSDICPGGVICLQYADDTILFSDSDTTYTANLKKCLLVLSKCQA
jgi:hypothetical protein